MVLVNSDISDADVKEHPEWMCDSGSMEFNLNVDNVHENCALNLAIRSELFGPAFGGSLNSYKTQIGANVAYLWKGDDLIGMFPTPISFKKNIDYVIEFGAVDVDENETDVFLKINGETMFNVFDKNNPYFSEIVAIALINYDYLSELLQVF